ncbi:MAG TPA: class I SAM-dependent methyltransferase [Thermoanaerobaculia bacterium]|nr:class I SAM-dependent methyltransferase [Thermoanaerobaculia bacterium]
MNSLSTLSADSMYKLDERTRNLLIESAPLMESWSTNDCACKDSGGMEEWAKTKNAQPVERCDWYHGTWQYLRLLNMVAVPPWYEFYQDALSNVLRRRPKAEVLISAAADYGMLATLHDAIRAAGADPRIAIYDICHTPLRSCQWYAESHRLSIECTCDNLLTCDIPPASFDLIVTDEFLTVIKSSDKPLIVKRWRELLKPSGTLVTTAMIGGPTTPELRQGYAERARHLLEANAGSFPHHLNGRRDELLKLFQSFARHHTRHMLADEKEIRRLFDGFGEVSFARTVTPGECVNPTVSFQIVATVP